MFEPSEHLWQVWGLILNAILPLLPTFWGFSALGHGVSAHSCYSHQSSTMQLLLQAPFNIIVIQVYVLTNNTEVAEVEWLIEDLQDLLELTPPPPKMSFSLWRTGMQKKEVKKYLE